jgi:hypothetical protein
MNTDLLGRPSKADTGQRNDHDFYETPEWMTAALLAHLPIAPGSTILEPCAGDGAIARVLTAAGHHVLTNDIDERHPGHLHYDATGPLWTVPELDGVDWVISNPPFNVAFPILAQAFERSRVGVAFLLRKTFLEPTKERGPWLEKNPPAMTICLPRHSFRGKGSDSVSTDWFVWLDLWNFAHAGGTIARPIVVDAGAKGRV